MHPNRQLTDSGCPAFPAIHYEKTARFVLMDGFGQHPRDRVTWQVASALKDAFPAAKVVEPIAAAVPLGPDTMLQLTFRQQALFLERALDADERETHLYVYSQGVFPAAALLARRRFPQLASVTLVGPPLRASTERRRILALDVSDMGSIYEHVSDQLLPGIDLAGVVRHQLHGEPEPYFVAVSVSYRDSFPWDRRHWQNLAALARTYPTTLVVMGEEKTTDCYPDNARSVAPALGIPFAASMDDLDPLHPNQAIVIDGASHRLGVTHRTVTIPRLYRLRTTTLAQSAWPLRL